MTDRVVEILYVEDDPADVELTMAALQDSGVANTIYQARDGVEALDFLFCRGKHADRGFSNPKVVLLDLKLPKISGLEVLQAIRADERTRMLPVVILTSSREQRDLIDSYKLGVNSFIQKPVDFEQFSQTIRQMGFYWLLVNEVPPPGAKAT
jgi:two-component system response regulator